MRNFFFMVFCMVALLLPENLWAQTTIKESNPTITVNGTTLTVNSTASGTLKSFMDNHGSVDLTSMKACTSIVLIGNFDSDDLSSIRSTETDFRATSVDMSAAEFVHGTSSSSVPTFESTSAADLNPNVNVGTIIKVGDTFYEATENSSSWSTTSDLTYGDTPLNVYYYHDVSSLNNVKSYAHGTYAAVGTAYTYNTASWTDVTSTTIFPVSFTNRKIYNSDHTPEYEASGSGKTEELEDGKLYFSGTVYHSYEYESGKYRWEESEYSEYSGQPISGKIYVNENAMNAEAPTATEQWAVVQSKVSQYSAPGWKEAPTWVYGNTFDPAVQVYESQSDFPANPSNGARAFAGTYYKFSRSFTWTETGAPSGEADYSMMKFTYWSSTLQTAKTSKYADSNISGEIFQNCKSITHIDFLGGHVKGLENRTTGENNYANFTLFVGKNVTEIEPAALNQSTALTGLTFDKSYTDAEKQSGSGYPKELTIGNMAFNGCFNFFSVEIPNRCTSIGNNAFKNVGNGADGANNYDPEHHISDPFTLAFERRSNSDDPGHVGIDCDFPLEIGNSAFQDCWYLKTLSLPIRLKTLGEDCFKNTKQLMTLEMREESSPSSTYLGPRLRTIPSGAFYSSALESVTIPKCVKLIEGGAFGDTEHLKKVVFQDTEETDNGHKLPLIIKAEAFTGGQEEGRPQLDVYCYMNPVYDATINPNPGRYVTCEYHAFNYTQTVGQTSTTNNFAHLHFPEEAWDYYQGNWKRGLAFRQDNLNAFKDGYTGAHGQTAETCVGKSDGSIDDSSFNSVTMGKYQKGESDQKLVAPANGWQEFARTSTNIDIIIDRKGLLRTYSTLKPQVIPRDANTNNPLFATYRITDFTYTAETKAATATLIEATINDVNNQNNGREYIPANTGLILLGNNLPADYIFYLSNIGTESKEFEYPYQNNTSGDRVNLLYPTCIATQYDGPKPSTFPGASSVQGGIHVPTVNTTEGNVVLYATVPNPYNRNSTNPAKGGLQYHLFGLSSSAAGQFNRIKNGTAVTRDKAYLKLTPTQFPVDNEGENVTGSGVTPPANAGAPIMLSFMDPEGNTTAIRMIDPATMTIMEDCYYTLQGVKLNARPTQQGIYIHNGKKVVIK